MLLLLKLYPSLSHTFISELMTTIIFFSVNVFIMLPGEDQKVTSSAELNDEKSKAVLSKIPHIFRSSITIFSHSRTTEHIGL